MTQDPIPPQSNTLGKVSLILGIIASSMIVCLGLCAGVGQQQGWLRNVAPVFAVAGGTFGFVGVLAAFLGFGGLFGKGRSKATAIVGLLLGLFTIFIIAAIINAAKQQ